MYIDQVLQNDSSNIDACYTLASMYVQLMETENDKKNIATYISNAKAYIDKTLQRNQRYAKAWYMLGRWHYDIINFTGFKKAALQLLHGGLPKTSIAQAIQYFEKCATLDPLCISNYLYLAKAYKSDNQLLKESSILQKALRLPTYNSLDKAIKLKIKKRLEELQ